MATITINKDDLDERASAIGLLIGLLNENGKTLTLNDDWFQNPWANVAGVPKRPERLLDLLTSILGDPATNTPNENDRAWYPVTYEKDPTGLYFVLSKDHKKQPAYAGVGLWKEWEFKFKNETITITPYFYFPLFSMTESANPTFVLGDKSNPVEIAVEVKSTIPFNYKSNEFYALQVKGSIYFDETLPSLEVNFLDKKGNKVRTYDTLKKFLDDGAEGWINVVLEQEYVKKWFNTSIGTSKETPGTVLTNLNILKAVESKDYYRVDVEGLKKYLDTDPLANVVKLVFTALDVLSRQEGPLIKVGNDGIYIAAKTKDNKKDYGIRVRLPDINIIGTSGDKTKPQLELQLGKWFTGEDKEDTSWLSRAYKDYDPGSVNPGIAVYLVQREEKKDPTFKPRLELVSIGLDYVGGAGSPLVNVKGFQLGGFEPRVYVALDLDNLAGVIAGGGMRLDKIAVPLGTDFGTVGGKNPIAADLLSTGKKNGDKTDAINPPFSISAGWVDKFNIQLYGPDDAPTDTVWFPIQRSFGPLSCQKIGVGWQDSVKMLSILFDGSVSLAALTLGAEGLSVGIPVTTPTDYGKYELGLDGLDIEFKAGPVEITGGLLKNEKVKSPAKSPAYDGSIVVKVKNLAICGLGSYVSLEEGGTSFFAFAVLDYPIGGPSFFFITALAAGFGYNRSLKIPKQDQVQDFPLVAALADPAAIGGDIKNLGQVLEKMNKWITPTRGEYWLAAGLSFTSFDLIHTSALAAVKFGSEFEVVVMGLSTIKLPTKVKKDEEVYVYARLMMEVALKPAEGVFSASAVLSPDSFVLVRECHLTGGFAFMLWFGDNPHAGDFVLTLGGYHPAFKPPAWYPQEPRLGFNWPVSDSVSICGGAYFALTPSAAMAGGSLQVTYHNGNLKAWFTAYADMLVFWNPFYFIADIGVTIGASYHVDILCVHHTYEVELGATMELWGPPTGGKVHVDWIIISFTVAFGADKRSATPEIDWTEFRKMLPKPNAKSRENASGGANDNDSLCFINCGSGLLKKTDKGQWIIRPDEFSFSVTFSIPAMELKLKNPDNNGAETFQASSATPGVRPMGKSTFKSTYTITIKNPGGSGQINQSFNDWYKESDIRKEPEAIWGKPIKADELTPDARLVEDCIMGLKNIRHTKHADPTGPDEFPIEEAFQYATVPAHNAVSPSADPPFTDTPQACPGSLDIIKNTLMAVKGKRDNVFSALASLQINAGINGDLTYMCKMPAADLEAAVMTGTPVKES